jgi:hypothetical protein
LEQCSYLHYLSLTVAFQVVCPISAASFSGHAICIQQIYTNLRLHSTQRMAITFAL